MKEKLICLVLLIQKVFWYYLGYLGEQFAQEYPLSLTASICFEQLYGGVDGDSASSTELYAILSSLSELPISQGMAVTGSVNQKGEIQPIGRSKRENRRFLPNMQITWFNRRARSYNSNSKC